MSIEKKSTSPLRKAYSLTFRSFKDTPSIFTPFIIFACLELSALILFYFFPRMPLKLIFGPPIRTLWGEQFLHYPLNFILLPKLMSHAKMFLSVFFGSLLTAMAIAMARDLYNKKNPSLKNSFLQVIKKYIYLFIVVLIFTGSFYFLSKLLQVSIVKYFIAGHRRLLFLSAKIWLGPLLSGLSFILAILMQAIFVYAIPLIIIDNAKLLKAFFKALVLLKKLFFPTLILVGLPMLLYVPVILLHQNIALLIDRLFPEAVIFVLLLGIVISSVVIDSIITVSISFLYLLNKEKAG